MDCFYFIHGLFSFFFFYLAVFSMSLKVVKSNFIAWKIFQGVVEPLFILLYILIHLNSVIGWEKLIFIND